VLATSGTSTITLGSLTTTGGGIVTISNSDSLKLQGAINIDGAFSQINNDPNLQTEDVEFGSSTSLPFQLITTGDNIGFEAPITMLQNSTLTTGVSGLGSITLGSSVDSTANGQKILTLTNSNGATNLGGSIGAGTNA